MGSRNRKKVFYNIISGLGYQFVIIALGFIMPRLYMVEFGSAVNGVLSTIKQIFAYLWLLEAGVGLATSQALYGPIAKQDRKSINSILAATSRCYLRTGAVYAAIVLAIAFIYSFLVADTLSPAIVFALAILNGLPTIFSYLVFAKYRLFLEADGQSYVITTSDTIVQLATSIGKLLALLLFKDLVMVQAAYCICAILQLLYLYRYTKRNYPWLDVSVKPDFTFIEQKSSVLIHQISGVVFNNTDIILLSIFSDLKIVSVYSIYNLFFTTIQSLISTVTSSITFFLGQLFNSDRKRFMQGFEVYETVYIMATTYIFTMMGLFLLPLIRLYTSDVTDINYIDSLLLLLFVAMNLLSCSKVPVTQTINFSGRFKDTQNYAVIEMVLNVGITIVGILVWGIYGGLLGSVLALIYRCIVTIRFANKKIFERSSWHTYRRIALNNGLCVLLLIILGLHAASELPFMRLLLLGIIYAVPVAIIFLLANILAERSAFHFIMDLIHRRRYR